MSAKQKPSDKKEDSTSYVRPNNDPELEKKVDELLSVEEPKVVPNTEDQASLLQVTDAMPNGQEDSSNGPPLLPTEKLKAVGKKKSITVKSDEEETPVVPVEAAIEPVLETEPTAPELPIETEPVEDVPAEPQVDPFATAVNANETDVQAEAKPDPDPEAIALSDESGEQMTDDLGLDDVSTGKAVDEIVASEADELLVARDKKLDTVEAPAQAEKKSKKSLLSKWWHSKPARNITFFLLFAGIAAAAVMPDSRYFVLNTAGVRVSSSITVLDQTTSQPLKNAVFTVGGVSAKTDSEGTVKLEKLKLGPNAMTVKKPAFGEVTQTVTLGWGSNPLGEFKLVPAGTQYKFTLTDFVSKTPISKAEASSDQADARSNEKGELVLTIPRTEKDEITVEIKADNYRTEILKLPTAKQDPQNVSMVPARKHAFISKRSGKYDVYKTDVDGKNEEKAFAGTGSERSEAMSLSIHPTKDIAAVVSNRGTVRNSDGFNLSTLTLIDLKDNTTVKVDQSERIQLIDWIGSKLIFVKIADGESAASPNRHRLVSYDIVSNTQRELAATNYFNDVVAVGDSIYYSPAIYQVNGTVGLFKINAEGNYKKTVYDKEAWNLFRTAYDKISVSVGQDWYDLNLGNDSITKASSPPPVLKSRIYFDNPSGTSSLWTEERDGKGVLIRYEKQSREDKAIQTQSGLKNPLRWLDDSHYIYRVSSNQETADYIASTNGGEPKKIRDVTDTAGIDRWYYY